MKETLESCDVGIQSNQIYHLKGEQLQMFLWLMDRFYEAGQSGDALDLLALQKVVKERIETIVNNGIR
jgi:hypothetical protein